MKTVEIFREKKAWLFSVPDARASSAEIIKWWERRRLPYNLIVGLLGIIGLFIAIMLTYYARVDYWFESLSVIVAPFMFNFFYTGGWVLEVIVCGVRGKRSRKFGPALLRIGICVSLLPVIYWSLYGAAILAVYGNHPVGASEIQGKYELKGVKDHDSLEIMDDGSYIRHFVSATENVSFEDHGQWQLEHDGREVRISLEDFTDVNYLGPPDGLHPQTNGIAVRGDAIYPAYRQLIGGLKISISFESGVFYEKET